MSGPDSAHVVQSSSVKIVSVFKARSHLIGPGIKTVVISGLIQV